VRRREGPGVRQRRQDLPQQVLPPSRVLPVSIAFNLTSPLGSNFDPRVEVSTPGLNFVPWG
jgi:hypothetical protein